MVTQLHHPRSYTRFIPREEISDETVTQWSFGVVGQPHNPVHASTPDIEPQVIEPQEPEVIIPMIEESEHQTLLQQAWEQAMEQGYAEGLAEGQKTTAQEWQQRMDAYVAGEGRATAQRLDALVQSLEGSLEELQQRMARELLQLACDIARQVVRRDLVSNPQALLPVVREALDMFVKEGRAATVRINPQDWKALESHLRGEFGQSKVQWQPDPTVATGDCLVESGGTLVDGRLEKRWERAVAVLGLVSHWPEEKDHAH